MDAVFGLAEEHYAALAPCLAVGSEIVWRWKLHLSRTVFYHRFDLIYSEIVNLHDIQRSISLFVEVSRV